MASEIIRELKIDLHDSKYIQVNAKQYDRDSRHVLFTCYNKNVIFPLNKINHHVYIRYRKIDNLGVFNSCKITNEGKILVELSEQMLAMAGKCYADLVIVHNDPTIDDGTVMSTMVFCVNVIAPAFDNQNIESSYEYNALNELLIKANTDYNYVMVSCRVSEDNAKMSERNAKVSENASLLSEQKSKTSEQNALESETNAKTSEQNALESETNAKSYEESAKSYLDIVTAKATEVSNNTILSKSYAVGGTNTRDNEDKDNAKYYYNQAKIVSNSIGGTFTPNGTITFSQLQSAEKNVGYVYHISDSFVTDDSFKCGSGIYHSSGTNVYYTSDGYWDCLTPMELTGDIHVEDDDNGNVIFDFVNNDVTITYEDYIELSQMVSTLQEQIKVLTEQTVLGITE